MIVCRVVNTLYSGFMDKIYYKMNYYSCELVVSL